MSGDSSRPALCQLCGRRRQIRNRTFSPHFRSGEASHPCPPEKNLSELEAEVENPFSRHSSTDTLSHGKGRIEVWDANDFDPWKALDGLQSASCATGNTKKPERSYRSTGSPIFLLPNCPRIYFMWDGAHSASPLQQHPLSPSRLKSRPCRYATQGYALGVAPARWCRQQLNMPVPCGHFDL